MGGPTRRRLPARVYWVRRTMVLGIAVLLVVGIARLLGGGGDGGGGDRAATVADTSTPSTSSSSPSDAGQGSSTRHPHRHRTDAPVTPVAMPSGPCGASDVAITPSVPKPVGGSDIDIVLDVSSLTTPACSWSISPTTLAMTITSGSDMIWTTAQCSHAIPTRDVVLRQDQPTRVRLTWDARRSEPGCPARTAWALPGTYHLETAALGGQPQETTFLLTPPSKSDTSSTSDQHGQEHHHEAGTKKHQAPPG